MGKTGRQSAGCIQRGLVPRRAGRTAAPHHRAYPNVWGSLIETSYLPPVGTLRVSSAFEALTQADHYNRGIHGAVCDIVMFNNGENGASRDGWNLGSEFLSLSERGLMHKCGP